MGQIEIGCDGLSALNNVTARHFEVKATTPHFDIIIAIRRAIQDSPLTWIPRHVKGHQDDLAEATLDRSALLILKWILGQRRIGNILTLRGVAGIWYRGRTLGVWYGDRKFCKDIATVIRDKVQGEKCLTHWEPHTVRPRIQGRRGMVSSSVRHADFKQESQKVDCQTYLSVLRDRSNDAKTEGTGGSNMPSLRRADRDQHTHMAMPRSRSQKRVGTVHRTIEGMDATTAYGPSHHIVRDGSPLSMAT